MYIGDGSCEDISDVAPIVNLGVHGDKIRRSVNISAFCLFSIYRNIYIEIIIGVYVSSLLVEYISN